MDKKNIIIGALIFAICVMSIGYAALSTTLTINGTATISQDWDVEITGIAVDTSNTSTSDKYTAVTPTFTATTATFDVTLLEPGAHVTYDITIQNKGTINATRQTAAIVASLASGFTDLDIIDWEIVTEPAATLNAGATTHLLVKVTYDENASLDAAKTTVGTDSTTGNQNPVQEKVTVAVEYHQ